MNRLVGVVATGFVVAEGFERRCSSLAAALLTTGSHGHHTCLSVCSQVPNAATASITWL
jgi:hypothetical protein